MCVNLDTRKSCVGERRKVNKFLRLQEQLAIISISVEILLTMADKLDIIEADLVESLSAASQALKELSKERPNGKLVESFTNTFMSRLDRAGSELSSQIGNISSTTTEGSSCRSKKMDLEHARIRLNNMH